MSLELIIQDDNGIKRAPSSDEVIKDSPKNVIPLKAISLGATGVTFGAAYTDVAVTPIAIGIEIVSKSGTGTDPILKLGLNATDGDLVAETTLTGISAGGGTGIFMIPVAGLLPKIPAGTPINLNVTTAAGYTLTVQIRIFAVEPAV